MASSKVFFELYSQGVHFEEMVLKPNMVLSGYECSSQASVDEVANTTIECFMNANKFSELPEDLQKIVLGAAKIANMDMLCEFISRNNE